MSWLAALGVLFGRFISLETLKFLAIRSLLIALCLGLGPLIIFKGFGLIMKFGGDVISGLLSEWMEQNNIGAQVVELYGVGAWIGSKLRVAEAMSVFLSFLSLKFALSFFRR